MSVGITIYGTGTGVVPFEGLTITEALSFPAPAPSTVEFEIVDTANAVTLTDLADIVVADGGSSLFRGQVIHATYKPVANYRRIKVQGQDYNRLTPTYLIYPGGFDDTWAQGAIANWRSAGLQPGYGYLIDMANWLEQQIAYQAIWRGRWAGHSCGYVFRQLISLWWRDDRSNLAAPVTRNSTTLAADATYVVPGQTDTIHTTSAASFAALDALAEPYYAWIGQGPFAERVQVTDGFGTTTLTVVRGEGGASGYHYAGSSFVGPMTDYATYVQEGGPMPAGGVQWVDVALDVALTDLASISGSGWTWWLDADLAWHFTQYPAGPSGGWQISGNDNRLARRLPYFPVPPVYVAGSGFSDSPDNVSTWATHGLEVAVDSTQIAGRAFVRAAIAGNSRMLTSRGTPPPRSPDIVVSTPAGALTDANSFGYSELGLRSAALTTATFYAIGGPGGWKRGQYVNLTNQAVGLFGRTLVLRSVKTTLLNAAGTPRYDFDLGDQRTVSGIRSVSGSLLDRKPRTIEQQPQTMDLTPAKTGANQWAVIPLWDAAPKATTSQMVVCQLVTSTGEPRRVANIAVNWHLYKNSEDVGIGSDALGSYLLYAKTLTDANGQAANTWALTSSSTKADIFEILLDNDPI